MKYTLIFIIMLFIFTNCNINRQYSSSHSITKAAKHNIVTNYKHRNKICRFNQAHYQYLHNNDRKSAFNAKIADYNWSIRPQDDRLFRFINLWK